MRYLAAVIALMLLSTPPALAQGGGEIRQYFRDWLAACRTDGYCSATSYQNPNPAGVPVADHILRVGRHAEQTYWEISLTTIATQADEWSDFVAMVDGEAASFSLSQEVGAYGAINDFFFLGDKAQGLMDRMVAGQQIEFTFNDTAGTAQQARFSLSGLSAALLWIDEQQKRIGSERVASAPPHGLTPTGSNREAIPEIPTALLERLRADPECTPLEELPNGRDIVADELEGGSQLYILPCWGAAYNFGSKVFVGSGESFEQLYFADYSESHGWSGTPYVVNAEYLPDTRTLLGFYKGRGLGDCGSSAEWQWADYDFKLVRLEYREACDGGPPGDFPVIYEAPPAPSGQQEQQ